MTTLLLWRALKWMGLLGLGYAAGTALWGSGPQRQRAGLMAMPLTTLVVFISGFGLLELRGETFTEPWVAASLVAAVAGVGGAALHVTCAGSRLGSALVVGGLTASVGFMVARDAGLWPGIAAGVLGAIVGGAVTRTDPTPVDHQAIFDAFRWVARAEGVSLLVLFGIAMPVKYGLGEPLVVAWTGWLHGVLFLLFLMAVGVGVVRLGWSLVDAGLGFVASLLPGGTFWFEARMARKRTTTPT